MSSFFRNALDVLETIIAIPLIPIILLIDMFLPDKANSIVLLGTKCSGKSTLWKELGGIEEVRANTNWEPVQSFEITRSNGTKVKISETADIGGEDFVVGDYYGRLIKEDTFIYYLVDSNDVSSSSKMQRVRSDLIKINKIINEKGIEENIGFKFILTHFYDYMKNNPNSTEYNLYRLFLKAIEKSKGRGVIGSKLSDEKLSEVMMVAELNEKKAKKLGKDYIDIIRNEIGK